MAKKVGEATEVVCEAAKLIVQGGNHVGMVEALGEIVEAAEGIVKASECINRAAGLLPNRVKKLTLLMTLVCVHNAYYIFCHY